MTTSIHSLLVAAVALATIASCTYCAKKSNTSSADNPENPVEVKGNTYVLVHGAWQAPYVWDAVSNDLIKNGNKVIVVELPGHGKDQTPTYQLNLDVYRDKVIEAMSKVEGKVILAGHSLGGMVVTHVAEKVPSKISTLVYIGAFIPASGQALTDISDPESQLGPELVPSADNLTLDVKREKLTDLFIKDGSQAAKDLVIANYRPEPAIPFTTKVMLTNENFGAVNKVYIKTLQDIVISPGLQDRMIAAAGIKTIYEINTSHSPFLAKPQELSELLLKAGK